MSSTLETVEQNFVALASSSTGVAGDSISIAEDRESTVHHVQGNKSFDRVTTAANNDDHGT